MRDIGILGGTFDPIHAGHLYLARAALRIFSLEEVILMPARIPPHKKRPNLTGAFHRFAMAAIATIDQPRIVVSAWELAREAPSYTVETLKHFTSSDPENRYCFVAGGDSLKELHLWKDYDTLLKEFSFIFFERVGVQTRFEHLSIAPSLKEKLHLACETEKLTIQPGISYLVRSSPPSVSSTELRHRLSAGLTPEPDTLSNRVLNYIRKHRLYEGRQEHSGHCL